MIVNAGKYRTFYTYNTLTEYISRYEWILFKIFKLKTISEGYSVIKRMYLTDI